MVGDVMVDGVARDRPRQGVLPRHYPSACRQGCIKGDLPVCILGEDQAAFVDIAAPVRPLRRVLCSVSVPAVGCQHGGIPSACGGYPRDEVEHVPAQVLPRPSVMGGVPVGVVGEGGERNSAPVGAGVGERGDAVAREGEGEVVLRRGSRCPEPLQRRDVAVAVICYTLLGEGIGRCGRRTGVPPRVRQPPEGIVAERVGLGGAAGAPAPGPLADAPVVLADSGGP